MKIKSPHLLITAVLLLAVSIWVRGFWFTEVFRLHRHNESNRAALLRIHESIPLGAPYSDTLAAYWHHRTDDLRLSAESPTSWIVRMPLEFGASDWNLRLEFHDGRVTAIQVRTSDGPPPTDGPADKQS